MPPRNRKPATTASKPLPSDGDDFWKPTPPTLRQRLFAFAKRSARRGAKLFALLIVASTIASIAYDAHALRRATRRLAASVAAADGGDVPAAREAFGGAFDDFQWSEVREGGSGSRSAVAAGARLLRLPWLRAREPVARPGSAAPRPREAAPRARRRRRGDRVRRQGDVREQAAYFSM